MYEIMIQKCFDAEHAIYLYDKQLEQIHTHRWEVQLTVGRQELDQFELVMDFHVLETAVMQVINSFQGKILNQIPPFLGSKDHLHSLKINPTAERIAWWFSQSVKKALPPKVKILSVRIQEAPGCYGTWRE